MNNFHRKLESNVFILQEQNQQQKQEIEKLKSINLKEKESNLLILKRMKSELSLKEQSLNSLVKQISNEVANSDLEKMNSLEVFNYFKTMIGKWYNQVLITFFTYRI